MARSARSDGWCNMARCSVPRAWSASRCMSRPNSSSLPLPGHRWLRSSRCSPKTIRSFPSNRSIGGVLATNISGSRRILSGSARDHLLGVQAVNGRGETIRSGGRVMKNVTGYDLSRALAGSWGTLAVLTEVAIKVLPTQREVRTLLCFGLADPTGVEVLGLALGTPFEVSGTVHVNGELARRFSDE